MENNNQNNAYSIGLLGARGYVGKELLSLIKHHPKLNLDWVSSRQLEGKDISELNSEFSGLIIESISAAELASRDTDIIVLALPNDVASPYVEVLLKKQSLPLIIDLSADYRFDHNWQYMLPEIVVRDKSIDLGAIRLISNPGCYATAMQLALQPLKNKITGTPNCFGVSGYSGAGTTPSPKNDPQQLKNNLIPYALINHLHEKEVSFHVGNKIRFSPHVASFFRGINMTIHCNLKRSWTEKELFEYFSNFYSNQPLIIVQQHIPEVKDVQNTYNSVIGGFALSDDGKQLSIICCLDNLLKGAASQALQNINLVCGFEQTLGLEPRT